MKGIREALLAIALVVPSAFVMLTAPAAAAGDADCPVPWGVASSAPAQDDAASGFDAGDAAAYAVPLPGHGDYGAWLDPVRRDGGDAEDWYEVRVPASGPVAIKFSVARDYAGAGYHADVDFRMEVFPPGAVEPAHATTSADEPVVLTAWTGGAWRMRVTVDEPMEPFYVCGTGGAFVRGTGQAGLTTAAVRNHIVYFGCEPHCAAAAA